MFAEHQDTEIGMQTYAAWFGALESVFFGRETEFESINDIGQCTKAYLRCIR